MTALLRLRTAHLAVLSMALLLAACATTPGARRTVIPGTGQTAVTPAPDSGPGSPADPRALIVRSATAMLGQPYRWGGAAPGGFDCSGLVVYATAATGIRMPRTAREQLDTGVPVSRDDVQAGDLVFMRLTRKELHVGIALGHDDFIHAPATGGRVRIDSLQKRTYALAYLTARRIIANGTPRSAATVRAATLQ